MAYPGPHPYPSPASLKRRDEIVTHENHHQHSRRKLKEICESKSDSGKGEG
ncbi:hypothetical protein ZHAS_00001050 [Anopheles sinensis]|uniref:Uncharacterized protein n=1 Tax=Anopheles sinensis TaxID=74873 RepID=A0A084VAY5_ANOSI|nr:hypothetical protein ZHAS_00001050 [Anopheles sinensis]